MPTDAERSLAVFPGGSLGEYDLPPGDVLVLARGEGARVPSCSASSAGASSSTRCSTKLYLSLAHGDFELARFLEAARAALRDAP